MQGRSTVIYLIETARIEKVAAGGRREAGDWVLDRAERRLKTALAGIEAGDVEGAFAVAYDAYRMAGESLLLRQCLRPASGAGSHAAVEDAVSAQFAVLIPEFAKPTFERFRRSRHAAQYYDDEAPPLTREDARWAITVAEAAVQGSKRLGEQDMLAPFSPD